MLSDQNYTAQGLKAKEPSCVGKAQYLQIRFANARLFCNHLPYSLLETNKYTYESCSPYTTARNTSLLHHSTLTTHYRTDTMLTSSLFP